MKFNNIPPQPDENFFPFPRTRLADNRIKTTTDRKRIDVDQEYELRYWSGKLDVSEQRVKAAVKRVGTMADDVAGELAKTS
ncbi:MAG TPA: DUF3606 domain-containing protein [Pseudolabrys sp.]|nr:DUF3606 domain-containing protein [Pseudolabrys sp.]